MYIWNVTALVQELKSEGLSQKEQLKYFLTYILLMLVAIDPYFHSDHEYVIYDTIDTVISLVITIVGVIYCYKVNESVVGKDFILRFVTLGLPITVRLFVFLLPFTVIYYVILNQVEINVATTQLKDVVFTVIFMVSFYYYFSKVLKTLDNA